MTDATPVLAAEPDVLAPLYPLPRLELASGRGAWVVDAAGTQYLDFVQGIAVHALGHSPRGLSTVVAAQMRTLDSVSNLFGHQPGVTLARALCDATGYARVFFCNSGTEGTDAALKFARAVAHRAQRPGRDVLAFHGGFHGRTGFALSATYHPEYRAPFAPLIPGIRFAPFNDVAALDAVLDQDVCAVIVEPVQGEGGAVTATREFLTALAARARAVSATLIFDEVQSGMGRCGHLLAAEHFGVRADITVLSKAIGGGYPLGAVLMTDEVAQALAPGMHGCTFGGSPVATAAGNFVLERVKQPAFLARVRRRAKELEKALVALVARHPSIGARRGLGLLRAIELAADAPYAPADLVKAARDEKLLLIRGGERAVRLLPPLTVTSAELAEAIGRLDRALTALESRAASASAAVGAANGAPAPSTTTSPAAAGSDVAPSHGALEPSFQEN